LLIFIPEENHGWSSPLLREWLGIAEEFLSQDDCLRYLSTGVARLLGKPPLQSAQGHFKTWMWFSTSAGVKAYLVAGRWVPADADTPARWVVTFRRDQVPADDSIDHVYQQMLTYSERMAHVGTLRWEPRTDTYLFSENLPRILGLSPGSLDFPMESFLARMRPEDREAIAGAFARLMEEKTEPIRIHYALRLDAGERWIKAHLRWHQEGHASPYVIGVFQDVTEEHEHQVQIMHSESLYRSLVESQSTFLVRTDLEARYTFVNQAFLDFFGFTPQEVLGKPYHLTVHPEDHPRCESVARRCLTDPKGVHRVVMRKPNKDGVYFWSRWEFKAIFDEAAQPVEVQAVGIDLTEQINAEQALQRRNQELTEQKALLEMILENIQDGVVVCDLKGDFMVFNSAAKEYLGLGSIDTSPETWQEDYGIFHADQTTPFAPSELPMARGLAGHKVRNLELFIRNQSYPAGRYLNSHASPLFDQQGQPIGAVGVLHDIDALKRVNERLEQAVAQRTRELRDSEARYRQLTELSRDVICLYDLEGNYLYVSPAIYELTGYQPQELIGRNAYDFIEDAWHQSIYDSHHRLLLEGKAPEQTETYRFRRKDGTYLWMESLARPIINEQGEVIQLLSSGRDITERKEAEERIEQNLQRERELNELKSHFVSMASHQFRTPLSAIQSSAQLLQTRLEAAKDDLIDRLIGRVLRQARRMTNLIDDVLTLSRIEEGRIPLNPTPVDFPSFLQDLMESFDQGKFEFSQKGTPAPVCLDSEMMRHALGNLLHNALKYSAHQSQPPELYVRFQSTALVLEISDHGIGIPIGEEKNLFQPFYRAANAMTLPGTGLGLVISREIIERHGGELSMKRTGPDGTCFGVRLPYAGPVLSPQPAAEAHNP